MRLTVDINFRDDELSGNQKIGHATAYLSRRNNGEIDLQSLRVPAAHRRKGAAHAAMKQLTARADRHGATMHLIASPLDRKTSTQGLVNLYKKHGFQPTGEKANIYGDPMMKRTPRSPLSR